MRSTYSILNCKPYLSPPLSSLISIASHQIASFVTVVCFRYISQMILDPDWVSHFSQSWKDNLCICCIYLCLQDLDRGDHLDLSSFPEYNPIRKWSRTMPFSTVKKSW